ncbi:MAG: LamG domain-containing protein [Candidatus Moranbacteria bacterium]|nr:LamG domain-containing protein [Candidatus Moranbacteria bacterium]
MSPSYTQSRVFQWIGIIIALLVVGGAYWYFSVRASTLNQSKNDLVTNGLVGLWSFNGDDISGTTAYDRSGNGFNGTLTNGPTKIIGKVSQAIDFDGSDDYVTVADNATLDVGDTADLSISGWFYRDTFTTDDTILAKRNGITAGDTGYLVYIDDATDQLIFEVSDGTDEYSLTSTSTFTAIGWNHFAIVWDENSAANAEIYVNGVANSATDSGTIGNIGDLGNAIVLALGAESDAGNPFDGKIDEVRAYNRTLTTGEVQSLYAQGGGTKVSSAVSSPQGTGRLDSGLAGYWQLDENTGTSAGDASTNGNTGTLTNGPTWTTGQIGSAVTLDGADDHIDAGTGLALTTTRMSVGFWINPTAFPTGTNYAEPVRKAESYYCSYRGPSNSEPDTLDCGIQISGGTAYSVYVPNSYTPLSTWSYVMMTADGNYVHVYINGVEYGTGTSYSGTITNNASYHLFIGTYGTTTRSLARDLNGKLDEVRIYDRALSADEVGQLYRLTAPTSVDTGLKGYWSFNGQDITGTTAYDRSGAGNSGTLTSGPVVATGILGQAVDFDGTDDYVTVVDNTTLDVGDTADMSISGWFYRDTFTTDNTIIAKRNGITSGDTGYLIYIDDATDQLIFEVSDGTDEYSLTSASTFTATGWNHYAVVWDQDSAANSEIYINGSANGATDSGTIGNIGDLSNALTFRLGAEGDSGNPFDGKLDESRFYSRALSAAEIRGFYDASAPDKGNSSSSQPEGTGQLNSGLATYFALDENTGTSTTDSSANGGTGTLTNGPTWTTGQIGSAVDFDGTDDYITVADADVLDVVDSRNFTLSGWFTRGSYTTDDTIVAKSNGQAASDTGYNVYIDDTTDKVTFVANDGTDQYKLESASVFNGARSWGHFSIVWDDSGAGQTKLYIDGVLEAATATGTFASVNSLANASTFRIGAESDAGNPFIGEIDEVRMYSRALTGDEISQLYRLTTPTSVDTGLKGYWSFNGQDMNATIAFDRSGVGNNGTLTLGPTKVPGKIGQGLSFDNSDDYVSVPDVAILDAGDTDDLTITGWFYRSATGSVDTLVAKRNGPLAIQAGYAVHLAAAGDTIVFEVSDGTDEYELESTTTFTTPGWHHFAVVWDQDSAANSEIYVNGVADSATDTGTIGNIGDLSNALTFTIGTTSNGSYPFNGKLDEIRVYKRTLSAAEITALYNRSR